MSHDRFVSSRLLPHRGQNNRLTEIFRTAAIANAIIVFITFLTSLPALLMPTTRAWLKVHGYLVVVCALMSLVIGLELWFDTLKTRSNLSTVWALQTPAVQSLLQQKLQCCGYLSSTSPPFVTDSVCTNALVAAQLSGCVGRFSSFANNFLDLVFTAVFGVVGMHFSPHLCSVSFVDFKAWMVADIYLA
jgi:hypothetical protein